MSKKITCTFTSGELARAFGVSRSTILRFEDAGLITPCERSGRGNSRHYDVETILKLRSMFHYHDLGYTMEDTVRYFNGEEDLQDIIKDVESRILELNNVLNALKNRTDMTQHLVIQEMTVPAAHYYCQEIPLPKTNPEAIEDILSVTAAAIRHGYTLRYELPVTCINLPAKALHTANIPKPMLCVPITNETEAENVIHLPREEKLCVHWFGEASRQNYINEYLDTLLRKGIDYDEDSLFRVDILSFPLDAPLPKNDSWVLRFYLP